MNKIFYDFETSGLSKWYDIPLDGAFVLTDENLNKIDEYSSFMAPKNCQEYIYRMYTDEENIEKARLIWNSIMK